ncbi:MAG: thymidylate kinase [Oscillospiraceae bacterium]|nr:thymidylate kinase [Oscillospiraceae bacterium]
MNESSKGKLIVIDGLDGSGKSTQFERLKAILSEKHRVTGISFPEYDKPSATLVKMYLNGEFSKNAADVNAYAASTFYAADRYASFKLYWEKAYNNGDIILASRYVCSNAIHQMSKLPENEWDDFLVWLADYEYNKLCLPRPDKTVILDIPVSLSQKRLSMRYNGDESKKDIHEGNIPYMEMCRRCALYAAEKQGWSVVSVCSEDGREYTPDEITDILLSELSEVI